MKILVDLFSQVDTDRHLNGSLLQINAVEILSYSSIVSGRVVYSSLQLYSTFFSGWAEKYPDNPLFQNIELLENMFKDGKYGIKSGEGFYKYGKK